MSETRGEGGGTRSRRPSSSGVAEAAHDVEGPAMAVPADCGRDMLDGQPVPADAQGAGGVGEKIGGADAQSVEAVFDDGAIIGVKGSEELGRGQATIGARKTRIARKRCFRRQEGQVRSQTTFGRRFSPELYLSDSGRKAPATDHLSCHVAPRRLRSLLERRASTAEHGSRMIIDSSLHREGVPPDTYTSKASTFDDKEQIQENFSGTRTAHLFPVSAHSSGPYGRDDVTKQPSSKEGFESFFPRNGACAGLPPLLLIIY